MSTVPDELEAFYQFAAKQREADRDSFTLERAYRDYLRIRDWQPKTEFGRKLKQRREEYIAGGGKLFSADEINAEVREHRGSMSD